MTFCFPRPAHQHPRHISSFALLLWCLPLPSSADLLSQLRIPPHSPNTHYLTSLDLSLRETPSRTRIKNRLSMGTYLSFFNASRTLKPAYFLGLAHSLLRTPSCLFVSDHHHHDASLHNYNLGVELEVQPQKQDWISDCSAFASTHDEQCERWSGWWIVTFWVSANNLFISLYDYDDIRWTQ